MAPRDLAIVVVGTLVIMAVAVIAELFRQRRSAAALVRGHLATMTDLAARFGLPSPEAEGVEGRIRGRQVRLRPAGYAGLVADLALGRDVVPLGVTVAQADDGPYQKQEDRAIGEAHLTGDEAFDAAFLAYGPPGDVRAIAPETRAVLVARAVPCLHLEGRRLAAPLAFEPEAAAVTLEAVLALADALDGAPHPEGAR